MINFLRYKSLGLVLLISILFVWAITETWSELNYFRALLMGTSVSIIASIIFLSKDEISNKKWKNIPKYFLFWKVYPISIIFNLLAVSLYQSNDDLVLGYMIPTSIWIATIAVNIEFNKLASGKKTSKILMYVTGGAFTGIILFLFSGILPFHFLNHLITILLFTFCMLILFILIENIRIEYKDES
jgi:hypothetical protein